MRLIALPFQQVMEKQVDELLSDQMLLKAALWAGTHPDKLSKLGDFENYVFDTGTEPGIMRMSHSSHRSEEEILSELDVLLYWANNGVNVAKPVTSQGKYTLKIDALDNSYFTVCLFEKAAGTIDFDLTPEIVADWGRITGQMHRLTKSYLPGPGIAKRFHWTQDRLLNNKDLIGSLEPAVNTRLQDLMSGIQAFPEKENTFGLIHSDLHQSNFLVNGFSITAFDFDDCCYHYFAEDIAIPLYYSLWKGYNNMERKEFTRYFLSYFIKGYQQENALPDAWKEQLPWLLDQRSMVLYLVLTQKLNVPELNGERLKMYQRYQDLALGNKPLFNFDLEEVLNTL